MPPSHTIWHPAGCACLVDYIADDATPNVFPVYSKHIAVCSIHAVLGSGSARWDAVVDESQTGQNVRTAIMEAGLPEPMIDYESSFVGKGRAVRITIPGLTQAQRGLAQAAVAKFGAGKVVIA